MSSFNLLSMDKLLMLLSQVFKKKSWKFIHVFLFLGVPDPQVADQCFTGILYALFLVCDGVYDVCHVGRKAVLTLMCFCCRRIRGGVEAADAVWTTETPAQTQRTLPVSTVWISTCYSHTVRVYWQESLTELQFSLNPEHLPCTVAGPRCSHSQLLRHWCVLPHLISFLERVVVHPVQLLMNELSSDTIVTEGHTYTTY